MKTAFDVIKEWRDARSAARDAIEKATAAVDAAAEREFEVAVLLRKSGPVVHDGHVYWFRNNQIDCEPCVHSLNLRAEGSK